MTSRHRAWRVVEPGPGAAGAHSDWRWTSEQRRPVVVTVVRRDQVRSVTANTRVDAREFLRFAAEHRYATF